MIYVSIFKEKSQEYKKILDLKATDKVRDTFYSAILDIIAAYESGLADAIKKESEDVKRVGVLNDYISHIPFLICNLGITERTKNDENKR